MNAKSQKNRRRKKYKAENLCKLTFETVGMKLVWFNFDQKAIWHFDMDQLLDDRENELTW